MAAVLVDQGALRVAPDERLEFLLAMDVDQPLAEFAHGLRRQRLAIDVLARAPVAADHAPQDELAVVGGDRLLFQPAADRRIRADLEGRRDLGALRAMAQRVGARAPAEREHHGVHDDGLAGAGLAGQGGQAAGQLELDGVDDREVADLQVRKHDQDSRPPVRPLRPQCSLDRSRRK